MDQMEVPHSIYEMSSKYNKEKTIWQATKNIETPRVGKVG